MAKFRGCADAGRTSAACRSTTAHGWLLALLCLKYAAVWPQSTKYRSRQRCEIPDAPQSLVSQPLFWNEENYNIRLSQLIMM